MFRCDATSGGPALFQRRNGRQEASSQKPKTPRAGLATSPCVRTPRPPQWSSPAAAAEPNLHHCCLRPLVLSPSIPRSRWKLTRRRDPPPKAGRSWARGAECEPIVQDTRYRHRTVQHVYAFYGKHVMGQGAGCKALCAIGAVLGERWGRLNRCCWGCSIRKRDTCRWRIATAVGNL